MATGATGGKEKITGGPRNAAGLWDIKKESLQLSRLSITPAETSLTKFTGLSDLRMYTTIQSYGKSITDHSASNQ